MSKNSFVRTLVLALLGALPFGAPAQEAASPEVTIAFFGDQGLGADAEAVLELVRDEGADAVVHAGDFDYENDAAAWEAQIDAILGPDFPYFASAGNHDEDRYYHLGGYQDRLAARMDRLGLSWEGDLGVRSSFHFRGIFIVLTAPGSFGGGDQVHAPYIRDALAADESIWSVSAWHKNMRLMQVGGKSDETGWGVYEESRRGGAIVVNAHEHSYSRTHLLADVDQQLVASTEGPLALAADDPATPEDEGRAFVAVSGLGGHSIRDQEIGGPWWASVYTSNQGASFGALFGVFNYQGDPNLARFYFKDVNGAVVDDFFVTSFPQPAEPSLRIEDVAVAEGAGEALIRVKLLGGSGEEVAVDYATHDGDATAGADYAPGSGRLLFSGEVAEQSVRVPIQGDEITEGDESFFVELSAAEGAVVARARGSVTILDDDLPPAPLRLDVAVQGSGLVTLDPPGGVYPAGTRVTLSAVAAPGFVFAGWNGVLSGSGNPAILVLDRDHQITARFAALEPSLLEVETGAASNASSVSTAAPLDPGEGQLYLAAVSFKPNVSVTGVWGLGLAWSPVRAQCAGRGQTGLAVWQARGEPTAGGVVTASFSGTPASSVLTVSRYGGVAPVDPVRAVSANTLGAAGACAGGSDSAAYSLGLATAVANSRVYVAAATRTRDHLPGPGFVERARRVAGSGGDAAGISVADLQVGAAGSLVVQGQFSGTVDWAVVAVEIPVAAPYHLSVEPSTGGSVGVAPPFEAFAAGAAVALTAIPQSGYRFTGWSGDLGGAENPATLVMNADKTVRANFAQQFSVIALSGSGGTIALDPPGGHYDKGTTVTLTAVPHSRHRFTGWTGALLGLGNPATLVIDSNKLVLAGFVQQFSVSALAGTGGSVELDPPGGIYDDGSSVTLTAVPEPGYHFGGWGGALSGVGNPAVMSIEADEIVAAMFVPQAIVSVVPGVGGSVALDPPGGVYEPGTLLTLTALPDPGYRFTGWSGALAGGANPASLVVDSDASIAAGFAPIVRVSVDPAAGGSVALDPPGGIYDPGTLVTLTALPDPGYRFTGWGGALAGVGNPASLVVDADAAVSASFVRVFRVSVDPAAGGSVALDPPGGLYDQGASVTVTATPAAGGTFGGWNGDLAGAANPASLVVDRDLRLGASFLAPAVLQETRSGASTDSRSVSTAGPLAAAGGDLYLAAIAFKPNVTVTGVSGLGLAWSPVRAQCAGRNQTGIAIWQARGQPTSGGVVTATLSATPQSAAIAVTRYASAGALAAEGAVSANSVGVAGACTGGSDQTAYAFQLVTTTPGGLAYVAAAMRQRDHIPGNGYGERVELHAGSAGSATGLSVADRRVAAPGPTAVQGGFDGVVDWAAVALEIPAAPAAP
jgi:hypothetical protein